MITLKLYRTDMRAVSIFWSMYTCNRLLLQLWRFVTLLTRTSWLEKFLLPRVLISRRMSSAVKLLCTSMSKPSCVNTLQRASVSHRRENKLKHTGRFVLCHIILYMMKVISSTRTNQVTCEIHGYILSSTWVPALSLNSGPRNCSLLMTIHTPRGLRVRV